LETFFFDDQEEEGRGAQEAELPEACRQQLHHNVTGPPALVTMVVKPPWTPWERALKRPARVATVSWSSSSFLSLVSFLPRSSFPLPLSLAALVVPVARVVLPRRSSLLSFPRPAVRRRITVTAGISSRITPVADRITAFVGPGREQNPGHHADRDRREQPPQRGPVGVPPAGEDGRHVTGDEHRQQHAGGGAGGQDGGEDREADRVGPADRGLGEADQQGRTGEHGEAHPLRCLG